MLTDNIASDELRVVFLVIHDIRSSTVDIFIVSIKLSIKIETKYWFIAKTVTITIIHVIGYNSLNPKLDR